MVNAEESFKQSLNEMKEFLTTRKKLSELAAKSNVSLRTVYNTFDAKEFNDMKGRQIDVYRNAIEMINEINSLQKQSTDALNKIL